MQHQVYLDFNRPCGPGGDYWNCYFSVPSLNQVTANNLKIFKRVATWLEKDASSKPRNGHQMAGNENPWFI